MPWVNPPPKKKPFSPRWVVWKGLWLFQESLRSLQQGFNVYNAEFQKKEKKKIALSVNRQFTHRTLEEYQKVISGTFQTMSDSGDSHVLIGSTVTYMIVILVRQ